MQSKTIHVRVQADTLQRLQARSLQEMRSLSSTAAVLLTRALDDNEVAHDG